MSADITIRPVTREDHDLWMPLWKGYQRFYKTDIPDETSAVTWRRFLDPDEPMFAALAFDGARAVGMVHYIFTAPAGRRATMSICRISMSMKTFAAARHRPQAYRIRLRGRQGQGRIACSLADARNEHGRDEAL